MDCYPMCTLVFMLLGCCHAGVLRRALDVVLVADSTDLVGFEDWGLEQTVMSNALSMFQIGYCHTRVLGLVRYGSTADVTRPMVDIRKSNNRNTEQYLDGVELLGGSPSNLPAGLDAATQVFGGCYDRPGVLNVAIVITSSNNCSAERLRKASDRLKEVAYVVTYGMDVGRNIQQFEVDMVATSKDSQLHYAKYYEAIEFFRNLVNVSEDCSSTDCVQCPDNYIPGELKHQHSSFTAVIQGRLNISDTDYLRGGQGIADLTENESITLCRPLENSKLVSFLPIRLQHMKYFKFHKVCLKTRYATTIYIGSLMPLKPQYKVSIDETEATDWTLHCVTGSTFYTWRKIKISFDALLNPLDGAPHRVQVQDLYMDGCYCVDTQPFYKIIKQSNKKAKVT